MYVFLFINLVRMSVLFYLQVSAAGLLVCLVASFLSTDFFPVKEEKDIEWVRAFFAERLWY